MRVRPGFPILLIVFTAFATPVPAQDFAPMALNSVGAVPGKIVGAPVKDMRGAHLGQVTKIETDAQGKPLRADIALTGGQTVFLDPGMLGYDEGANVLVTSMDQQQLAQMSGQPRG